jgi:hypothetical protein
MVFGTIRLTNEDEETNSKSAQMDYQIDALSMAMWYQRDYEIANSDAERWAVKGTGTPHRDRNAHRYRHGN